MTIRIRWGFTLKLLGLVAVLGLTLLFSLSLYIVAEAPLERLERVKPVFSRKDKPGPVLEQDALVSHQSLLPFITFGEGVEEPQQYIKGLQTEEVLALSEYNKNLFVLKKDFQLPALVENNCPDLYCFQHRISFEQIPSVFWKGLIGIEDYRFLNHKGVDLKSIARAIVTDIKTRSFAQGGSTLTQQLVKNLFYSNEKKLSRKVKEIILSLYLETKYDKENIMEAYFNEVFWGAIQGVRVKGLYAASLFYFGRAPAGISAFEASILIGLLKGPNYYNPLRRLERLKKRAAIVFNKLKELNFFPSDELGWDEKQWKSWHENLLAKNKEKKYFNLWRVGKNKSAYLDDFEKFHLINQVSKVMGEAKERAGKKEKDLNLSVKIMLADISKKKSKPLGFTISMSVKKSAL